MKKILCMLLALVMLFALCACGGKTEPAKTDTADDIDAAGMIGRRLREAPVFSFRRMKDAEWREIRVFPRRP